MWRVDLVAVDGAHPASVAAAPNTTDWMIGLSSVVTALVAVIAIVYAAKQVTEAQASRKLTRDLEEERAQPYVVLFAEPSVATNHIIDLVLRNFGMTAARDVKVVLDPWPERSIRSGEEAMRTVPIPDLPFLAPGQEWRTRWDFGPDRLATELPDRHVGVVTFKGIRDRQLQSECVLDWSIYRDRTWVEIRGVHDAATALREMVKTMKAWHEVGGRALSVYVRDGAEHERQMRQTAEERYRRSRPLRDRLLGRNQENTEPSAGSGPDADPG